MLTYTLAHIVNALLFAGIFGATFVFNEDDENSTSTTTASNDDGFPEAVTGGAGDDILTSDDPDGANFIAGDGNDSITGTEQDDTLQAGEGDDIAEMNGGDDRALGKAGNDTLDGGAGDDILNGAQGGISLDLDGNIDGADSLFGGVGDDSFLLGVGDVAEGGEGLDIFTIDDAVEGEGFTTITDFTPADDTLQLEYTPTTDPATGDEIPPNITVTNFADGTGASILINGVEVAQVTGAQDLDPADVALMPV